MLKLPSKQIEMLNKEPTSAFHNQLMTFLRKEISEATSEMDGDALQKYIVNSEKRAEKYNINSEAGIAQFICLTFVAGPEFDEIPEVKNYLMESNIDPDEKLIELIKYIDSMKDNKALQDNIRSLHDAGKAIWDSAKKNSYTQKAVRASKNVINIIQHPLLYQLSDESHSFSFIQVMRLLKVLTQQSNEELSKNISIHPRLSLSYPLSSIDNVKYVKNKINKEVLYQLKKEGLQDNVINTLEGLADRWYTDKETFIQCLERVVGDDVLQRTIFKLTEDALDQLKKEKISKNVYKLLSGMKNIWLTNEDIFLYILKYMAGENALKKIQEKIEKLKCDDLIIYYSRVLKKGDNFSILLKQLEEVGISGELLRLLNKLNKYKYENEENLQKSLEKILGKKDLSRNFFRISFESIEELKSQNITNRIIIMLESMKGLWYTSEGIFMHIITKAVGEKEIESVIHSAKKSTYKKIINKFATPQATDGMKCFSVTANFLGLYGISSPLPVFYTTDIISEEMDGETSSKDFLNIINQRLYHLLFRCYTKYNQFIKVVEEKEEETLERLFCLIGLGEKELRNKIKNPNRLLRYTGLLTQNPKTAIGLKTILSDALLQIKKRVNVDVIQCVKRKAIIPDDQKIQIGKLGSLGKNTFIGSKIEDRMTKFRIQIGPMNQKFFKTFFPGKTGYNMLNELTQLYLNDALDYDIELIVKDKINKTRLGYSRLGFDTWSFSEVAEREKRIILSVNK